jgi:glutamate/tyrosine decarboxylase-like PLP-dependent enzyme
MLLVRDGSVRLGELIHQNVSQASYLAELVTETPELELCDPVPLKIVCFRYVGAPEEQHADLDGLNRRILAELHDEGMAAPSHTNFDGRFLIRAAITNHRSCRDDFDLLVREVVERGRRLACS